MLVSPISLAPAYEILDGVCLTNEGDRRGLSDSNLFEVVGKAGKADGKSGKSGKSEALSGGCYTGTYRTCFHRSNSLDACDTISSGKPYIAPDEVLLSGTMHLTLLQDSSSVTCQKEIQLEKALLTYLADNIGSDTTFEPVCAYAGEYAKSRQMVPESGGEYADSTAIEIKVHYIQKTASRELYAQEYSANSERDLQSNKCTRADRALCCSQHAINSYIGEHCAAKGCNSRRCGSGRRSRKQTRNLSISVGDNYSVRRRAGKAGKGSKASLFYGKSGKAAGKSYKSGKAAYHNHNNSAVFGTCPWYGMMYGDDFNEVVKKYTLFNPRMTRSLIGVEDTASAAICSANRYSIDEMGTPSLSCEEFVVERCLENEDLPSDVEIDTPQPTPPPVTPAPQSNPTDPPTVVGASGEPSTSQVTILPTQTKTSNEPTIAVTNSSLPPATSVLVPTLPPQSGSLPTLPPINGGLPTLPPMNSILTPAPSTSTISVSPWTFESGVFPEIPWRTGGDGVWTIGMENVDEGSYSIKSPDLESTNATGPQVSNATLTLNSDFAGGLVKARVLAR